MVVQLVQKVLYWVGFGVAFKQPTKIAIMTGSYSLDGIHTGYGFPYTKTNVARKPEKGEIRCWHCDGDGWDADPGGVFICPHCRGYGILPESERLQSSRY